MACLPRIWISTRVTADKAAKAWPCSLVGLSLSLVYPLLGLVGWHKHWIEIAPVCILVISHLLDHSFTELFFEIGILAIWAWKFNDPKMPSRAKSSFILFILPLYSNEIKSLLLHLPFVHLLLPYLSSCSVPEQSLLWCSIGNDENWKKRKCHSENENRYVAMVTQVKVLGIALYGLLTLVTWPNHNKQ